MTKERNRFVDIMRGVAMLLVVLGHTMTGSTENSENTFIFGIVWSLQMPLFILISGYVTRYSREIVSLKDLFKFFLKRTTAYLLPFAVWSFLIRGVILNQKVFLDIKYMLWHVDSGYWFLITIWTISVVFGISNYISSFAKRPILKRLILVTVYVCGMAALGIIGKFAGMSFLGIKLTLYYMPFYLAGWLYGQYRDKIFALSAGKTAVDIIIAVSLAIWVFCLIRFNLFTMADSGLNIIIRATASLLGCIAVCGLLKGVFSEKATGKLVNLFDFAGTQSLGIYLIHGLLINLIKVKTAVEFTTVAGISLVFANYIVSLLLCFTVIHILSMNKPLCRLLGIKAGTMER